MREAEERMGRELGWAEEWAVRGLGWLGGALVGSVRLSVWLALRSGFVGTGTLDLGICLAAGCLRLLGVQLDYLLGGPESPFADAWAELVLRCLARMPQHWLSHRWAAFLASSTSLSGQSRQLVVDTSAPPSPKPSSSARRFASREALRFACELLPGFDFFFFVPMSLRSAFLRLREGF